MPSKSRIQLENWLKTIDVKGNVLDIGGSQNPIKGRTKSWDVKDYKILDLEQPHECKIKPDIISSIEKLDITDDILVKRFDNLFCIEVMEYIIDPWAAFMNMNFLLKDGGSLYISTHYLYGLHKPKNNDFMRLTFHGIKKLLTATAFEIKEYEPRWLDEQSKMHLQMFYHNEGMRIDYDDPSWCHSGHLIHAIKK